MAATKTTAVTASPASWHRRLGGSPPSRLTGEYGFRTGGACPHAPVCCRSAVVWGAIFTTTAVSCSGRKGGGWLRDVNASISSSASDGRRRS